MTSGVAVDQSCNELWMDFHSAKVKTRRVITFRVDDKYQNIVPDLVQWQIPLKFYNRNESVAETKEAIKQLKELICAEMTDDNTKNEPRWIIVYFEYMTEIDNRLTGKEVMIKWCPEGVRVKARMTFASSSKGFTDALEGFKALVLQADELDEIDEILPRFEKGTLK